jgi:hypothetical protein
MDKCGLSSTYRFIKTDNMSYYNRIDSIIAHDENLSHNWEPLINLDGKLKKWPIYFDYKYSFNSTDVNRFNDPQDTTVENAGNQKKEYKNIWTAKYTIPGKSDRELNLFNRWTIALKGDMVMSLNVNYNVSETEYDNKDLKPVRNWTFSIHPEINYNFTDYVDGKLEYIFDKNYQSETETLLTNNKLSLTIKLSLK